MNSSGCNPEDRPVPAPDPERVVRPAITKPCGPVRAGPSDRQGPVGAAHGYSRAIPSGFRLLPTTEGKASLLTSAPTRCAGDGNPASSLAARYSDFPRSPALGLRTSALFPRIRL